MLPIRSTPARVGTVVGSESGASISVAVLVPAVRQLEDLVASGPLLLLPQQGTRTAIANPCASYSALTILAPEGGQKFFAFVLQMLVLSDTFGHLTNTVNAMEIYHATHRGFLKIGSEENFVEIPCAVLENNKRIISQTGLFTAFNRPRKGEKRQEGLPSIIGAKNLLPFVTEEVKEKVQPIHYYHSNGTTSVGYDAELIPLVCELYLRAEEKGNVLIPSQAKLVDQARIIVRSLAKVGITALVDEATGYQYEREKDELQRLLSKYIAEDFLKWQSRFPRKYYQEVFRLHNWKYDPFSLSRPGYLGHFTNEHVYKHMPPGVLDELRKRNPSNDKGRRARKHHQHLTEDIGITHLDRHLTKLITVMELSADMNTFKQNFQRVFVGSYQTKLEFE